MQGFDKQQREKVREYIIKLNGDLRNFQDECQSKRKELASKKTKAIKDMKSNLKWCLESIRKKPFQWLADDIPTRRQDEPWSGYNESLKRTIVKRIDVAIMNDDGVKDICAKYQESHKDMLEKLSTKFKHLESHMSLHGPSRAIDGYDQQNLPFLYKLLGPFRKLFTLLKDILETNHILDTCYSEEEFSSDRNRYMKTQTENVLRFYAQEMQLQSTATAIVENMWDSVEKTISCFVACMHFRDKCLAEIFDSELDKRSLEYWRKEFFQPEVDKCSKVFISMVMKHDIDQSRLKIDNDIIAQCGYALVKKGNLTEGDREVEIAAKIVRRPASECEIDIFRECFLLRQLTLKAEASDGNVFPHLVKFYGSSYVEKGEIMELHLIMELCHTDLGERIKENYLLSFNSRKHNIPFPGRKALDKKQPCRESVFHAIDITRQAASGLEFIHKNGIIHRDVKANNFLMNQREDEIVIKIADFGVSRCNDVATTKSKSVGTQPYHAPEFYTRFFTTHTFSSDVYSFGLLLWEVWHGERVFDRVSSESDFLHPDTISKYLHWKDDHETRYSSDLQVLMKKCCNQKPKKRPEMKYVMDQLTRFAEKNKEIS
ncbi:hypothetical protein ACJMK2_041349 [Sinanodonta woodiana]|uniref:Protein kinase domain-containing protein n=2 Tax=Sinanodonta woodiana TaxID=1069815 RepID=A0ABD3W5P0_SINWO